MRVPVDAPRRVVNDSDSDSGWLIVGAPPMTGDGMLLDDPELE